MLYTITTTDIQDDSNLAIFLKILQLPLHLRAKKGLSGHMVLDFLLRGVDIRFLYIIVCT